MVLDYLELRVICKRTSGFSSQTVSNGSYLIQTNSPASTLT